jgi:aminoglycoside phosphotransferase (APT) family kinase protein
MPWRFDVSDEELRLYLPDVVADVGSIATFTRLEGGTYNTGVRVLLHDGREVVVKISPPSSAPGLSYESSLLPTEADYFVRTRPFGVPVPEMLAAGVGVIGDRHHLVMSKVPGRPLAAIDPSPAGTDRAALRRELGVAVARAHQAPCDDFGYMFGREQLRGVTWSDAFERMTGALLDDAERYGTVLPMAPSEIRELVGAHRPALAEIERPVLVHFDLWDGNLLVSEDGTGLVITGIIDGERALHGDPAFEFPSLTVFDERSRDPGFIVDEEFLVGYREVAGPLVRTDELLIRLALYRTYLYLVMLIEVTPREMSGEHARRRQIMVADIISQQLRFLQAHIQ